MKNIIAEKLNDFVTQEAKKAGYDIVDITLKVRNNISLEVALDKKGGITLDECSDFNRMIVKWLEKEAPSIGDFVVDVCSPGLDREIKSDTSFVWATGKNVKVVARHPVSGITTFEGKLQGKGPSGEVVIEKSDGQKLCFDRNDVIRVRLFAERK